MSSACDLGAEVVASCRGHVFPVWDVAAAPQGQYFASASADRCARVWVTERPQSLRLLAGHHSDVSAVMWHPNGDLLASGSDDRTIRLWDVRDGRPRRILVGHGCGVRAPLGEGLCRSTARSSCKYVQSGSREMMAYRAPYLLMILSNIVTLEAICISQAHKITCSKETLVSITACTG